MSNSLLSLDAYSFKGLELPTSISVKTKKRLVVHQLASGLSAVDALGDDVEVISFRGIFSGEDAISRIRAIEVLKSQNRVMYLSWASRSLPVMIRQFELNYISVRWIQYRLICYVVDRYSPSVGAQPDVTSISPNAQVGELIGLLQSAGLAPTSDQTSAILSLADLNYDIASASALSRTTDLLAELEQRQDAIYPTRTISWSAMSVSYDKEPHLLARLTETAGIQSSLLLARNRLGEIVVRATCVD